MDRKIFARPDVRIPCAYPGLYLHLHGRMDTIYSDASRDRAVAFHPSQFLFIDRTAKVIDRNEQG